MMWPFRRKTDSIRNALLRARARTRALENGHPTTMREATVRAAEQRADDLEERADKVEASLLDRLRRNNFAEGIAMSWGQGSRHRREGA